MPEIHHLRAAGTSVVLDARGDATPVVVHWGRDLGDLTAPQLAALADAQVPAVTASSVDVPLRARLVPLPADGWSGRPGLTGWRPGGGPGDASDEARAAAHPGLRHAGTTSDGAALRTVLADDAAGLRVVVTLALGASGVLESRTAVTNTGTSSYALTSVASTLPLPARAGEILDLSGHWSGERRPQRLPVRDGVWSRETRHGRPGHDAPFATVVGTPGFGFRAGETWVVHHAWSGDSAVRVEHLPSGHTVVGAGEIWGPRDVHLAPGEAYESPRTLAAWSGDGLDGASERFHAWVRARPGRAPKPRPLTLNTWEAVYFDHDLVRLRDLADAAARVGVERFVLDDGWFRGRRDDRRGLGDWTVDAGVWPDGLHPLVDHVRGLGMDFGLWVEPEMVNADSDLARAHPDWVLRGAPGRDPVGWRHQQVLDLARPDAYAHVRDALVALLEEYPVEYLKWDQNRDVLDAASRPQVLATRRLMDELQARFPGVEIESCSSGGGRVDLDVLDRTARVWASDTNDALEREQVQRWTGLLVPPELVGTHVGDARSHTTGRTQSLGLRLVTATFGHSGIESDLTRVGEQELAAITRWAALVRGLRPLVATGRTVRADRPDESCWVHGLVAPDGSEAAFAVVSRTSTPDAVPPPARLPGLDPARTYRVERVDLAGEPVIVGDVPPPWWDERVVTLPGGLLGEVGLPLPGLAPEQAVLLRLRVVA
ncbi:alpha-galactosidase [Cellulomonas sp. PhB143]|uniref:alpha-galactosidase n=1 Tax=Cellulomonas sp. PhB143 TaxID=2485186 RepID=UPI000F46F974|nr:alpha-galactosidase [Cellulomonas sp. PhB143]ROS73337.1 alpha-galactosidase [Cellulomonas sp. PhB143]